MIFLLLFKSLAQFRSPQFYKPLLLWALAIGLMQLLIAMVIWAVVTYQGWPDPLYLTTLTTVLLTPTFAAAAMALAADNLSRAVETASYPHYPPPREPAWAESLGHSIRFFLMALTLNAFLAPVSIFLGALGIGVLLYIAMSGYVVAVGFFTHVAARRFEKKDAREFRAFYLRNILPVGILCVLLGVVPGLNLLAPGICYVMMVHRFSQLLEREIRVTGYAPVKVGRGV